MKRLPKARSENIVQQEINGEILLYDLQNNTAYNLNETSAAVYHACDGETTFDELKSKHNFTDDVIFFALDQLNAKNLLEDYSDDNFPGMSRRDVIRTVGLGSMVALPLIAGIIAPSAANAASALRPLQASCTAANQCASGNCASRGTCCSSDRNVCTVNNDCCLTYALCQSGTCCRPSGRIAGFAPSGNPAICCSGVCNYDASNACVCT